MTEPGDQHPTGGPQRALALAGKQGRLLKAHGTGNDFVVVVDMDDEIDLSSRVVVALCDRHFGIGSDGVIRIVDTGDPQAPIFMDYRNADGAIVEMCGNGVRVVAAIVARDRPDLVADDATLVIDTRAGLRPVTLAGPPGQVEVTVDMGPATNTTDAIHLDHGHVTGDARAFRLHDPVVEPCDRSRDGEREVATSRAASFAAVSMGNPHAVMVVADVDEHPLECLGQAVGGHRAFREGVNVNIVAPTGDQRLALRVWERGVGETLACGTGACATVAAMDAAGVVDADRPVAVALPGGTLTIRRDDRGHMQMTGAARVVGTVQFDPAWLADLADPGDMPT